MQDPMKKKPFPAIYSAKHWHHQPSVLSVSFICKTMQYILIIT